SVREGPLPSGPFFLTSRSARCGDEPDNAAGLGCGRALRHSPGPQRSGGWPAPCCCCAYCLYGHDDEPIRNGDEAKTSRSGLASTTDIRCGVCYRLSFRNRGVSENSLRVPVMPRWSVDIIRKRAKPL